MEVEQVADGTLKYIQHSQTIDYMEGTSVTLECNAGYGLQGNSEATCTNGDWSATLGVCIQCKQVALKQICDISTLCLHNTHSKCHNLYMQNFMLALKQSIINFQMQL